MKEKVIFCWSGGKDSALALYETKNNPGYEIVSLCTTITEEYRRISMHGVREVLLERQAQSLGLPLAKIFITKDVSNEEYEHTMQAFLAGYKAVGVCSVVFADIFLAEVRKYRQENLLKIGMKAVFPLWGRNTAALARRFIDLGFRAVTSCVDSNVLGRRFVGRQFNRGFLRKLPSSVDPCGERGQFHSFVYDGPLFKEKVSYRKGEIILRDNRFYYCDLIPV
ncbi:MAG: diphthine--ammonia ligase [Candidatus Omnitrophota bacterium]|nr:MAG: diphthine--ammonia ligase [Candidatus Omnitrophota bacterium]